MTNNELPGDDSKTTQRVILCKTSYHYWRYWVSDILRGTGAKFKKGDSGWEGIVLVSWRELDNSRKILSEFIQQNPDTKVMWW